MGEYAEITIDSELSNNKFEYEFPDLGIFKDWCSITNPIIIKETEKSRLIKAKNNKEYWIAKKCSKIMELKEHKFLLIEVWYANKVFV